MVRLVGDAPAIVDQDQQEDVGERVNTVRERHGCGRDTAVDVDGVQAARARRFIRGRLALDLQRDQQAGSRQETLSSLHQTRQ